ncbi:hypothetical protein PILCRDRAFT_71721 [Piloderma croceum F 1598]|uniref:CHAT domain-containing protein n=1 Tax=Piloderma croceum (strain F 1598) TaxID=765440 RepID=A0A0C3FPU6_PILCF|nr:hypothetical protein PILCRDRAFT_71721 [Piloderma croceum F 1598]
MHLGTDATSNLPDQFMSLDNANALSTRFERLADAKDLDKAVLLHQETLKVRPAPHPNRSSALNNLAIALTTQLRQSDQLEDLEEAISLHRKTLELLPVAHPHRSTSLNNLANALSTRFEQLSQREDLDEAISFLQKALILQPAPHPNRSSSLNDLANALTTRFKKLGEQADLDDAILFHRQTLQLRPVPHPNRSTSLDSLANVLSTRFDHLFQKEVLDNAVSLHRDAPELVHVPGHRYQFFNGTAGAVKARFNQSGQLADLDEAISCHREALELRPARHPDRPASLNNLACALQNRFRQLGQRENLDEAIRWHNKSIGAGHPNICHFAANLGRTLIIAYSQSHQSEYLDRSMATYRVAVTCEAAPVFERFQAAKSWALYADYSNHVSALDAYQAAIELLSHLSLNLYSSQHAMTLTSDGLARDAAACAIRSEKYEIAVELLEAGRAAFWSQALQLRTPMMDLQDVAPELGERLRYFLALEQGLPWNVPRHPSDTPQILEEEASSFRRLNNEWLATLEDVRQLDGFQDFLRPIRLSTLQHAAASGPVVIINASQTDCAALILTSTGVQHIPFPDLSFTEATKLVQLTQNAIMEDDRDASLHMSSWVPTEGLVQQMANFWLNHQVSVTSQPDDILRYVLGVLWITVVEPIIRLLELKKSDTPPILRWCPTGPFAFLPVHAAGMYATETTESVFDYVVSSYTPTITSLLNDLPLSTSEFKTMVVIQPDTPDLKRSIDELQKIEDRVPNGHLVKLVRGSVQEVLSHLSETSIAHFACHGTQNMLNPLQSAFLLHDGQLKVSQIMQQSMPNASLAFLSACETATMDNANRPDEVMHLGAALLFAGFRGVITTMWSIADHDAPVIADSFYENLFKECPITTGASSSRPDITQAARALHIAVAKLRSEGASFARWVPFIHFGR